MKTANTLSLNKKKNKQKTCDEELLNLQWEHIVMKGVCGPGKIQYVKESTIISLS